MPIVHDGSAAASPCGGLRARLGHGLLRVANRVAAGHRQYLSPMGVQIVANIFLASFFSTGLAGSLPAARMAAGFPFRMSLPMHELQRYRDTAHRHRGIGTLQIHLQVRGAGKDVAAFCASMGHQVEDRISMGKTVDENIPGD